MKPFYRSCVRTVWSYYRVSVDNLQVSVSLSLLFSKNRAWENGLCAESLFETWPKDVGEKAWSWDEEDQLVNLGSGKANAKMCRGLSSYSKLAVISNSFFDLINCSPPGSSIHRISQTRILELLLLDYYFLLHGIFPIQVSNPCLLHWQGDSLPLSHCGFSYSRLLMLDDPGPSQET